MKTTPSPEAHGDLSTAHNAKCATFQLLPPGLWVRLEAKGGEFQTFDHEGKLLQSGICNPALHGTFIGYTDPDAGFVHIHDLFSTRGISLDQVPFRDRFELLRTQEQYLPHWARLTRNYHITTFEAVIKNLPAKGAIFRSYRQLPHDHVVMWLNPILK